VVLNITHILTKLFYETLQSILAHNNLSLILSEI